MRNNVYMMMSRGIFLFKTGEAGMDSCLTKMVARMKLSKSVLVGCLALLFLATGAFAQIAIELDGSGAGNLAQITVDGIAHTNFVGMDMTAFNFGTGSCYQFVTSGSAAGTGTAALALMEDTSLITGYAALGSLSYDFLQRVENIDGPEIFIFELGYGASEGSLLNVTLNGQTNDIAGGSNPFTAFTSVDYDMYRALTPSMTIAQLEAISSFTFYGHRDDKELCYVAVDLSDYGVALGKSVSNITISGDNKWDITAVVALSPPVDIELDGSSAGNVVQITVDGIAHTEFVDVDMTAFNFGTGSCYQFVTNGSAAATGEAATALMEDTSLITGYAALGSLSYDFLQRVENIDGPEIFIFEIGYGASEGSLLNVTLNGQTDDIAGGSNPFTAFTTVDADMYNAPAPSMTIAQLEAISSFTFYGDKDNIELGYVAVDLSDYGVADGERVSDITISGGGNVWDITAVIGLKSDPNGTLILIQ